MPDIYQITLPSGSTYTIKDAQARSDIANLKTSVTGAMHYKGITTTTITDGSTTATLTIDSKSVTFGADDAGSVVIYGQLEFVWNGTAWQELGSSGSLKALAFKDSASGKFTPAGNVTVTVASTSNKTAAVNVASSGTVTYTPGGNVSTPTFTGTAATIAGVGSYTPSGDVSLTKTNKTTTVSPASSGTATYTPAGNITINPINVNLNTTTVNSITDVGSLPTCTLPTLTTSVANETLTIGWSAGSFTTGTLPTKGANTTVATGVQAATATGSFTGTGVRLVTGNIPTADSASFSGSQATINTSASYTPEGSNSQPSFTGTGVRLVTGNIPVPSSFTSPFVGTEGTVTVS